MYRTELVSAGESSQAAGHLLPQFDQTDITFGAVIVGGYPPIMGEAAVVVLPVDEPAGTVVERMLHGGVLLHNRTLRARGTLKRRARTFGEPCELP